MKATPMNFRPHLTASLAAAALLGLGAARPAAAQNYAFTNYDYPGSVRTQFYGTNEAGTYVGTTLDPAVNRRVGLVYSGGVASTFEAPGASLTYAVDINSAGTILGRDNDAAGAAHGFTKAGGVYTAFDAPGALGTVPYSFNDAGTVVGSYTDAANRTHAFLETNGVYTTVDDPLGKPTSILFGINDLGTSVGYFYDPVADQTQGFLRLANGTIQNLNYPGSGESYPIGINDAGQIVGVEFDANDNGFGYLLNPNGTFSSIVAPGGGTTVPFSVDGRGNVIGYISDGSLRHAFIASPVPEASTLVSFGFLGLGLVALARRGARRRAGGAA